MHTNISSFAFGFLFLIVSTGCGVRDAERPLINKQTPTDTSSPSKDATAPESASSTEVHNDSEVANMADAAPNAPELEWLRNENFRRVQPVSSRSSSVRLILDNGHSAIFKPIKKGDHSARLEVAFYRMASMLGVTRVPVSVMRGIYPSRIESGLQKKGDTAVEKVMSAIERDEKGRMLGAMIEWLEQLTPLGVEDSKGKVDLQALFADSRYQDIRSSLVRMVMLDYLLSNWDRFSGGNLFRMSDNPSAVALIDHNEAFYKLSERQAEKLETALGYLPCFDLSLLQRIRELTKEKITASVQDTDWKKPLLNEKEIDRIMGRKTRLLQIIDTKATAADGLAKIACDSGHRANTKTESLNGQRF